MMGEVPLQHPVEESARHHQCKTGGLSNTVFNGPPVTSSITSFVKLPAASLKLVFEDAMENPRQDNQPVIPQASSVDQPAVPLKNAEEAHITQANLHQEKCKKFLKSKALSGEELKQFGSQMMEFIDQMATEYPAFFDVKSGYTTIKERLTISDLEEHKEKWKVILQSPDDRKVKMHISETLRIIEYLNDQIEYYEKERNTLRENARQREIMDRQKESLRA